VLLLNEADHQLEKAESILYPPQVHFLLPAEAALSNLNIKPSTLARILRPLAHVQDPDHDHDHDHGPLPDLVLLIVLLEEVSKQTAIIVVRLVELIVMCDHLVLHVEGIVV